MTSGHSDLSGRTLLILGGNTVPSKRRLFDAARARGLRILLAKQEAGWEREYCAEYLPISIDHYHRFDETVAALVEFSREHGVDGVTTTHDSAMPVLAEVTHALGLNGPSPETAAALRDKGVMRKRLDEIGVPSALSFTARSLDEARVAAKEIGFPVIVKPTVGTASAGVVLVHDDDTLAEAVDTAIEVCRGFNGEPELVVEEYLDGLEVTVDALVFDGEILFHNISDHPQPMPGPHFAQIEFVTPTAFPAEVAEAAYAAHALAIKGFGLNHNVIHTEMRFTSRGPRFLEMHTRPAGQRVPEITWQSMRVDLMGNAIEIAVGHRPDIVPIANGYAGYRCVLPERTGVLAAVHGVEHAEAVPGVFAVELTVPPGAPVFTLPEAVQQDVAYVFAEGETYELARERTKAALGKIRLDIA